MAAFSYSDSMRQRALRALRCSPFRRDLFLAMGGRGVSLLEIATPAGSDQGYTRRPLGELAAESHLGWLVQVGVLRREVDGQGLTDAFRLTPLGRQVVASWAGQPAPWTDCLANQLQRWRHRSL